MQHHLVFRRIVMCGLLDSFDKSRNIKSPVSERIGEGNITPPDSPTLSGLSFDDDGKGSMKRMKNAVKGSKPAAKLVSILGSNMLLLEKGICW